MNAVVDTDILIKSASYALMGPLVTESLGSGSVFGYLAVARFMVPKRLEAAKLRRPAVEAIDELKTWFGSSVPIETDDREQELAASLESSAQQAGVSLDQGESQLCAVLINRGIPLMLTGDKRAIAVTTLEVLNETHDHCSEILQPAQTMTDGGSGIVMTIVTNSQCSADQFFNVAYKTMTIDAGGAIATFASTPGYTIAMTANTGTAYLVPTNGGNVVAKDIATWSTKFTAPVAGPPLLPLADDGVVVRGNGSLVFLDGSGTITNTASLTTPEVMPVGPGLYQGTSGTGGAVAVTAPAPVRAGSYFVWARGNQFFNRQAQTCDPGHPPLERQWKAMLPGSEIVWGFSDSLEWNPTRQAAVEAGLLMWQNANGATKLNTRFRKDQSVPAPDRPLHITVLPQVFDANLVRRSALFWPLSVASGTVTKARVEIGLQDFSPNEDPITDLMFTKVTLNEIGHAMGLAHNNYASPYRHPYGYNGSSVMNSPGGYSDSAGWMSAVVTPCDADQAKVASQRWPR